MSMSGVTSGAPNLASPDSVDSSVNITSSTVVAAAAAALRDAHGKDEAQSRHEETTNEGRRMNNCRDVGHEDDSLLHAENDMLGELMMRLREERDAERSGRIAAETREREALAKLERATSSARAQTPAKAAGTGAEREKEDESKVREALESYALDLQDQVAEYKDKADRYDNALREAEAERQKRIMMEEIVSASPESGHIATLNSKCEDMQEQLRVAEEKRLAAEMDAREAKTKLVKLRQEAGMRESLLEREINTMRVADDEEITRLRTRVMALEKKEEEEEGDGNANYTFADSRKPSLASPFRGSGGAAISEMHKPEATTELHLHALSLIRDRSRLLRRLHRAETDAMLLRAQVQKLESSVIAGGEFARVDAIVKAAKIIASERGLPTEVAALQGAHVDAKGVESLLDQVRSLFLSQPPDASILPTLPIEMIVAYTRSLERALCQAKVDNATMKRYVAESGEREAEAAKMLIDATDRETTCAELLRVEINRARELERLHEESMNEVAHVEEMKFRLQQEAWRLRDLLAEKAISVPNDLLMRSM